MDNFTKSLLSMIMASRDIDIIADALNLVVAELEIVTASPAPVAPVVAPVAPVVAPVTTPVTYEDVVEQEQEDEMDSESVDTDPRGVKYTEIYGTEGEFLLLDEEDEIESGDEWIVKPEEVSNRSRTWRTANGIGHKVGEYQRSHYRRAI